MDSLAYDYGSTETTRSNRLLKVSDKGDKFAGFVDKARGKVSAGGWCASPY